MPVRTFQLTYAIAAFLSHPQTTLSTNEVAELYRLHESRFVA
jgi:hypothetical protein